VGQSGRGGELEEETRQNAKIRRIFVIMTRSVQGKGMRRKTNNIELGCALLA